MGTNTCAARNIKHHGGTHTPVSQNAIQFNKHAPSNNKNHTCLYSCYSVPETVPEFPKYILFCSPMIWVLVVPHFGLPVGRVQYHG